MWNGVDTRQLYKDRVEVAIDLWDKVLRGQIVNRAQLEEELYSEYKKRGIEPFRGFSKIKIYDKEIATVFVVGKYGLGLDDDIIESTKHIFTVEYRCDRAYRLLRKHDFNVRENPDLKDTIRELINAPDLGYGLEDRVFRMMRYVFTGTILTFFPEEEFVNTYKALQEIFPELKDVLIRYVKFYVAFKIAEGIVLGQISDPSERKIYKYVFCVKLNVQRCAPPDKLIREVALRVYKVPKRTLDRLFADLSQGPSNVPTAGSK
ncbi:MAG: DUF2192 domain-containing protein [Crenarchaeota archaeon]|nr:DUF2192 domain-containing protein [Thermoproteota archaeon]